MSHERVFERLGIAANDNPWPDTKDTIPLVSAAEFYARPAPRLKKEKTVESAVVEIRCKVHECTNGAGAKGTRGYCSPCWGKHLSESIRASREAKKAAPTVMYNGEPHTVVGYNVVVPPVTYDMPPAPVMKDSPSASEILWKSRTDLFVRLLRSPDIRAFAGLSELERVSLLSLVEAS